MNESPIPSRALRASAVAARALLWLLAALWLGLALAWGALHLVIVPRIGELRPWLEKEATRALGVPVRIGDIHARSEGLIPSFALQDVQLLDAQGRTALRLPRVLAALTPRSVWNLGFDQLYIDQPELDIRRAADGRFHVAGLDLSRGGENDGRAADWFFQQGEFVIRGGTIRWTDEMRRAPPLALSQVDFVMRNKARRHSFRLDATPPAAWGDRFTLAAQFRQPLLARQARWQDWAGQMHADFARVDVSQLRHHADLGVQITQGRGALRAWADVDRGQVVGGTADLVLADVEATLAPRLQPLALASVSGRVGGKRFADGFEFETRDLALATRDGLRWPAGNLRLAWTGARGQKPAQGEFQADRLELGALAELATRLPLGDATHKALVAYAPQGRVEKLQARWQGPLDAPQTYEARGRAEALSVAAGEPPPGPDGRPRPGTPGVRGAALDFDVNQAGGRATLRVADGALDLPGVFEERLLPLQALTGELRWQRNGEQIALTLDNLRFANADAEGEARATWRTGDPGAAPAQARLPGVLDLQGSLSRADGTRVWRYLPLGVPKAARDYVHETVQQGRASGARFRVRGALAQFPWADGKAGEFLITANVQDVTYAYVPARLVRGPAPWPALTRMSGELVFQGNGMQVRKAQGIIGGQQRLGFRAEASIPDFLHTVVDVKGSIQGPLPEALAVVNGSPLAGLTGGALARATGSGNAEVQLQLTLPVHQIETAQVQGAVALNGNDVQITPDSPQLSRVRGAVTFSDKGFQLAGVQARALGGDARLDGGMRDGVVQVRAQGLATAEGLRQARELGFVARLAADMAGATPYTVTVGVRRGIAEVAVASSLQGMALNLPAPLGKAAEAALPLRYENALTREALAAPEGSPLRQHDQLTVELGRLAAVQYVRDMSGAEPRVLRGTVAIGLAAGESVAMPEQGVMANINLGTLDVDAWEDALNRAGGTGGGAAVAGAPSALRSSGGAPGYLPTQMAVRARELTVDARKLHNIVVGGGRDGLTWRANVDADEFNGYLEYRQPAGNGSGRLYARLARLKIAAAQAGDVESLLDDPVNSIPAMDIVVDDFELKGRKLGRLEIDAVNRGAGAVAREGGVREWRLNKLALTMPEAVFSASGNWAALGVQPAAPGGPRPGPRANGERRRTAFKFQLDVADTGGLLDRLGMKDLVRRGQGRLEGTLAWVGSPLALDYPTLTGSFRLDVGNGQFLKADPGLAKLMGVLSLQALPRRLALDFRDVFSEGFTFDFVRGDVVVEQGIASTNNLQMKGVNAAVLMEGKADLLHETQDLKVVVVPEINAGTASLVATVINPAVGVGSFLAQMFLRQPLIRAATQEFHVDGTWSDPRVSRVGRTGATSASGAGAEGAPTR